VIPTLCKKLMKGGEVLDDLEMFHVVYWDVSLELRSSFFETFESSVIWIVVIHFFIEVRGPGIARRLVEVIRYIINIDNSRFLKIRVPIARIQQIVSQKRGRSGCMYATRTIASASAGVKNPSINTICGFLESSLTEVNR